MIWSKIQCPYRTCPDCRQEISDFGDEALLESSPKYIVKHGLMFEVIQAATAAFHHAHKLGGLSQTITRRLVVTVARVCTQGIRDISSHNIKKSVSLDMCMFVVAVILARDQGCVTYWSLVLWWLHLQACSDTTTLCTVLWTRCIFPPPTCLVEQKTRQFAILGGPCGKHMNHLFLSIMWLYCNVFCMSPVS